MNNSEISNTQYIYKLISSYAPSLPVGIFSDNPKDKRRHGQDNRQEKPGIPEHAPIEYICLLYRL